MKDMPNLVPICVPELLVPKGPRHAKNSTRSESTICSECTTRSDSLMKI